MDDSQNPNEDVEERVVCLELQMIILSDDIFQNSADSQGNGDFAISASHEDIFKNSLVHELTDCKGQSASSASASNNTEEVVESVLKEKNEEIQIIVGSSVDKQIEDILSNLIFDAVKTSNVAMEQGDKLIPDETQMTKDDILPSLILAEQSSNKILEPDEKAIKNQPIGSNCFEITGELKGQDASSPSAKIDTSQGTRNNIHKSIPEVKMDNLKQIEHVDQNDGLQNIKIQNLSFFPDVIVISDDEGFSDKKEISGDRMTPDILKTPDKKEISGDRRTPDILKTPDKKEISDALESNSDKNGTCCKCNLKRKNTKDSPKKSKYDLEQAGASKPGVNSPLQMSQNNNDDVIFVPSDIFIVVESSDDDSHNSSDKNTNVDPSVSNEPEAKRGPLDLSMHGNRQME